MIRLVGDMGCAGSIDRTEIHLVPGRCVFHRMPERGFVSTPVSRSMLPAVRENRDTAVFARVFFHKSHFPI